MDKSKIYEKLEDIKRMYQDSEVCMGEMLGAVSSDGFSIEDCFEIYIAAMHWSDGDEFYRKLGGEEELEELGIL